MGSCKTKEEILQHVTGHQLVQCPGNDDVDALAHIRWLEEVPAEDLATWPHSKTKHTGQKTM